MFAPWILALALPASVDDCDAQLRGRAIDAATGEGIAAAHVRLSDRDGERTTTADDDGRFAFEGVCRGERTLAIGRADYEPRTQRVAITAQDPTRELELVLEPRMVDRVDDVVVEALAPAPTELRASHSIDGEALAQLRGRNLADTLARVPGVAVLRGSGGAPGKPIIRGQDERRSLLIFDGVRHAGQKWGLDHPPEIDPFAADRITVIKGPGGIRYGPDAIGGVVLVEPAPLRTTPGVDGQAHLVGVSNGGRGTAALRLDGAHARARGLAWRVDGNITRGAAIITPRYPLDNTGALQWNAGARVGYQRHGHEFVVAYRRNVVKSGLCTCLRNATPEEFQQSIALGRPVNWQLYSREYAIDRAYSHASHDLALARAVVSLGDAGRLSATYSLQHNDRREFDIVRSAVAGPQYTFVLDTHGVDVAFERTPQQLSAAVSSSGTYGLAASVQHNRFRSNQTLVPDYQQLYAGVFAVERLVLRRAELQLGVRYDGLSRVATLRQRDYLGQVAAGRLQPSRCDGTADGGGRCGFAFHTGSASIATVLRPIPRDDGFAITIDLSSAGRVPAVDEMFLNGSSPSFPVLGLGDARLGVERTWGAALSLAYANRFIATDGAAWVNWIDDYIYFGPAPGGQLTQTVHGSFPLFTFRPVGALFYGGEYGVRVQPPKWPVELDGQLALVRAVDLRSRQYLVFIPADRYQLGLTYHWPETRRIERGFIGVRGMYVDRQRRFDPVADFAAPPPGYAVLGASVGFEVPLGRQRLALSLVGNNLTNTRYRDYTSLLRYFADEPGWELMLRASLSFEALARPSTRRRRKTPPSRVAT